MYSKNLDLESQALALIFYLLFSIRHSLSIFKKKNVIIPFFYSLI
ncbi:hypothetical protein BGP_6043 [Beggiatoa sp. PS]|nr:hypothetical protein BGP_6043 [Beggiatoa sp. PS]